MSYLGPRRTIEQQLDEMEKDAELRERALLKSKAGLKPREFTINQKIRNSIRSGINKSLSDCDGKLAGKKWDEVVGYDINDLMEHLGSMFYGEMSWENYGGRSRSNQKGWYIDKIIPVAWFVFSSCEDLMFRTLWSLRNLRPAWTDDETLARPDDMLSICSTDFYSDIMDCWNIQCEDCCFGSEDRHTIQIDREVP